MFEAKQRMINEIMGALGGFITAGDAEQIRRAVRDVADRYEIESSAADKGPDDLLEVYLTALEVGGRSPKTIERYRFVLEKMLEGVKVPVRRINVYDLRKYLADGKARGLKDSTLEGMRQVISAYFGWLAREEIIEHNPAGNLGAIKSAKVVRQAFTKTDIERLKGGCRNEKERAILLFLASTGCRVSEMVELNRDDLDLNNLECLVHGKGNKERTVYLDMVTSSALKEYLAARTDSAPAVFANRFGERITTGGVRDMLKGIARRAGVNNVHPHRFRRTLATDLIRRGMPIEEVASILGHDKLDTTMQYVVLCKDNVKNAYQRYA